MLKSDQGGIESGWEMVSPSEPANSWNQTKVGLKENRDFYQQHKKNWLKSDQGGIERGNKGFLI